MTERNPPDPAAFFREMLGQWESIANAFGAEFLKSGEVARTVQGAASAGLRGRQATHEAMARALAAANLPSREEIVDLGQRIAAMDERLARIEAMLGKLAGGDGPPKPGPKRTRKPPAKAAG